MEEINRLRQLLEQPDKAELSKLTQEVKVLSNKNSHLESSNKILRNQIAKFKKSSV